MPKKYIDEQEAKIAWYRELGATSKRAAIAVDLVFDRVPTADVEEVRHGEWINECILDDEWYHTCSKCNTESRETFFDFYCPVCGAKMDEGAKVEK